MKTNVRNTPEVVIDKLAKYCELFAGPDGDCWEYPKGTSEYGRMKFEGVNSTAHRVAYSILVEAVPQELQIDHVCRNTACVNPDHLEPVTPRENTLRGLTRPAENAALTKCRRGHEFTEANTYVARGRRTCRACASESQRRRYRERQGIKP